MTRKSAARRFAMLAVQALEAREVPANNLAVVGHGVDDSAFVETRTQAQTIIIETLQPNAFVSLDTIEAAMRETQGNRKTVIVTTAVSNNGTDGNQPGNITWNGFTFGDLDFTNFDEGKTLIFQTVTGVGAAGNIELRAVDFVNPGTEQISLKFDTSATNGSVEFRADGPLSNTETVTFDSSVLDLTVTAGTGDFLYDDADLTPVAAAAGNVNITAGGVTLFVNGGISAGGDLTVAANSVSLFFNTGLVAGNNLAVTGTSSLNSFSSPLTAQNGSLSLSGGSVGVNGADVSALTSLTVNGTSFVNLANQTMSASGPVSITSGGQLSMFGVAVSAGGTATISGADVQVFGSPLLADGDLTMTATGSVTIGGFSALSGNAVSVTGAGPISITDTPLSATADATLTGSTVTLAFAAMSAGGDLTVTATDVAPLIQLSEMNLSGGDNVTLDGQVQLGGFGLGTAVIGTGRDSAVTFTSTVDGTSDLTVAGGTISFGGDLGTTNPLDDFVVARGQVDLGTRDLFAATVSVGDGVADPLGEATLGGRGTITLNGNLPGTTADLFVAADGNLAPGGIGTAGTLTVLGNVIFNGGDFAVDLGAASDLLVVSDNPFTDDGNPATTEDVEGNIVIGPGSRLGGGLGTGTLPTGSPDVELIDFDGNLTGQFANAPLNVPVIAGTDAVRVTNYGPAGVGVTIGLVPAATGGVFNTSDPEDGTLVFAKLTGGGELVGGRDGTGRIFLVVRNSTPLSKLAITTKANGSDTVATIGGGIVINGPLAAFTAPRVNIGEQFRATGNVKVATFRDLLATNPAVTAANSFIDFGGAPTSTTTITARNVLGNVRVAGILTKLTATQNLGTRVNVFGLEDSTVSAASIGAISAKTITAFIGATGKVGTVTALSDFQGGVAGTALTKLAAGPGFASSAVVNVAGPVTSIVSTGSLLNLDLTATSVGSVAITKGILSDVVDGWNVANGIGSLKAGAITGLDLTARNLGAVSVLGTPDLSGTITGSTFKLTGNDGTLAKLGLKGLTAAGTVSDSTFDVKGGNVGAVKVGRFVSSNLYLNYTPGAAFNTGGTFGATGFKLTSFTTTALPTPDPNFPLNFAFQDSEIAADAIGTVALSGVKSDNGGTAFGVKVQKNGTVLVVKTGDAGFPASLLNKPINPNQTPVGDFYFLRV